MCVYYTFIIFLVRRLNELCVRVCSQCYLYHQNPMVASFQDSQDGLLDPTQAKPRQTGSMVSHHDDIITRMKNIQMIEIGKHRITPWYFSPYPQVSIELYSPNVCWRLVCVQGGHTQFFVKRSQAYVGCYHQSR